MSEWQMARIDAAIRERAAAAEDARKAIEEAGIVAMFARIDAERNVPYARPGDEPWRLMTAEQWSIFDSMNASWDRMEARYGRLAPEMLASVRNLARRIF